LFSDVKDADVAREEDDAVATLAALAVACVDTALTPCPVGLCTLPYCISEKTKHFNDSINHNNKKKNKSVIKVRQKKVCHSLSRSIIESIKQTTKKKHTTLALDNKLASGGAISPSK
jgi:hypothetical protein